MRSFKFFINYDKEEKWLNDMAKKGYELEETFWGYKFRVTKPKNTRIRIDYRTFKNKEDFEDYCALFEDSGWKHIAGTKNSGKQYFSKTTENSEEDIFSNGISRAARYKRLSNMWMMLSMAYFFIFMSFLSQKHIDIKALFNPKLLYYTPGLWERSGVRFWRSFLFETPFALLRGFSWIFIPVTLILYLYFSAKAQLLYNKETKEK